MKRGSSLTLVSMLVLGCDAPAPDPGFEAHDVEPAFSIRDSAGIQIAESARPEWPVDAGWTVEPQASLQLGSLLGDASQPALGRIADVVRFGDGRIAVADQQAAQVLVFDSVGRFVERWGGRGEGPGEFQRIDRLAVVRGDSLVVRNEGMGRHEIYGPDGVFARSVRATSTSPSGGIGEVAGWLDDGSFLVVSVFVPGADLPPGRQVIEGEWYRFDPVGAPLGLYAALPDRVVEVAGSPPRSRPVALAPRGQSHAEGSGLWHAFPSAFEIRRVGPDGVERVIRRAWTPQPVTMSLKEAYQGWYATPRLYAEVDESARAAYVELRRAEIVAMSRGGSVSPPPVSDTLPAFTRLVVARDGHLWAEVHASADELLLAGSMQPSTGRWTVFAPEGRWLGTVEMPEGLRVMEIGSDYVLGIWRDELDVEFVRLHRIVKDLRLRAP